MKNIEREKPLLSIRFTGKSVEHGRILLEDLQTFLSNFNLAVERTIDVLQTGTSLRPGRPKKINQLASALEIVAVKRHSVDLDLDLRKEEQRQLPPLDIGIQAIGKVMQGIPEMVKDSHLPEGFDLGVLIALRDAGRILERGIDGIHIRGKKEIIFKQFTYSAEIREAIISKIKRFEQTLITVEGRLLMADVKEDALRCRIHPSTGFPIPCAYDESLVPQIVNNLRRFVKATGEAQRDSVTHRIHNLTIYDLEPIENIPESTPTIMPTSEFWEAKEFNQLALEQGIYPIDDFSKIQGGFPEDTDFDSFYKAIMSLREN